MKRRMGLVLVLAVFGLVVGLGPLAHADEQRTIPAGSYTVDLPGGGTLGFTVDATGNVTITMVPDGTTAGPTSPTEEGFSVVLTNGTATSVVAVEVENEDGRLQVKAEQEVEGTTEGDQSNVSTETSGDHNAAGSSEVSSPEPSPEPTESETSSPEPSGDTSGDVSASPSTGTGDGGGTDG